MIVCKLLGILVLLGVGTLAVSFLGGTVIMLVTS